VRSSATVIAAILDFDPLGDRVHPGRSAAVVVLGAFLISFLAIRTSARLTRSVSWWPGGVESDGVHIHHLVWGICLMLLCGFLAFAAPLKSPWWMIEAAGFGIGAGFTLDEFALWVRLEDVYWTQEGRASVDAVMVACAFAGLVVAGVQPFGLDDPISITGTAIAIAIVLSLVAVCAAKDRVILGVLGIFVPVVAMAGAVRLARPASFWARRFYGQAKLERARSRFAGTRRTARLAAGLQDAIAGAPDRDPPAT
jgi:hypothetical protein